MSEEIKVSQEEVKVKILFVMIDGLSDYQHKDIDYKTPLQQANIPYMNAIARSGICGIHDPVQSGLACGSDTAHMEVFGYNPLKLYNGRGAFETIGAGVEMSYDDIAFKCNFAYINDENEKVERRRVDRDFQWGVTLCDDLNDLVIPGYEDYVVKCEYATEHRCGLKVRGKNLSSQITGTDPLKDNKKLLECLPIDDQDESSIFTAKLVSALSMEIRRKLTNHPINLERRAQGLPYTNLLLLRGCGQRLNVKTFEQIHDGLRPFMIAPTAIIRGAGMSFGVPVIDVDETTGYYNSNLNNKALKAIELITSEKYDFGFIHIKAIDDAGHDKNLTIKIQQLEKVDQAVALLINKLGQISDNKNQYIICVTGDHTTPIIYGDHTYEPVCIAVSLVSNVQAEINKSDSNTIEALAQFKDGTTDFNEIDCASSESCLGRFCSSETLTILKNLRIKVKELLLEQPNQ